MTTGQHENDDQDDEKPAPDPWKPRPLIPPAPGRASMPPPPSFGWIGDPDELTHGEMDEIARTAGRQFMDLERTMILPYVAVAYARRENRALYPWTVAKLLKPSEVMVGVLDVQGDQELADAQEAAVENGEVMPDPA